MKFADAFFLLRNSALWNWLLMLGCICAAASAPAAELQPDRPNCVFIMADDLGWADVQFHGGTVPTPHLNRLLAEGQELTQHYVAPLCTPTRTGLLSSRFWSRFGVTKPQNPRVFSADTVTLPKALQAVGYDTCLVGKWHLGSHPDDGPQHFGFEHSYGSLAGGVGPWNHRYKEGPFSETWHRGGQLLRESGHVTDLLCREAVDWIEARATDVPFFLYVPMTAVHLPVKEPEETLIVFTSDNGGSTAENHDPKYPEDDYWRAARLSGCEC
ncbi:MAG: sulfatase-like hydrolase/transferase [Planctomyces sp.]